MRDAFADEMTKLARTRQDVALLSGDIGNKMFDKFKEAAPDRFYNCGVAEANMMSVAAGMAMSGLRPVVYTITPFVTTRCLEQIRNDVCYHDVPVVIVGVGSGLGYASLGPTHHSCEDMSFLRTLPNMTVLAPADPWEVRSLLLAALEQPGPVYMRIGKKGEPSVHSAAPPLKVGQGFKMREGTTACLVSTGVLLPLALETADALNAKGISTAVVNLHTVKPLDQSLLSELFGKFAVVATIEEHSLIGGLGSAVAEWMADHGPTRARLARFGSQDVFLHESGNTKYARKHFGLTPDAITERVSGLVNGQARA